MSHRTWLKVAFVFALLLAGGALALGNGPAQAQPGSPGQGALPPPPPTVPPTSTRLPSATPLPPTPTVCALQFADVPPGDPFAVYIYCLACRGIVNGYTNSPPCAAGTPCFLPGNNVTRGQFAKFVANAAGYTDPIPTGQQTFADTLPSNPFWAYVERSAVHSVLNGYTCGSLGEPCPGRYFRPGALVTRGQAAKFVANAAGYLDVIPPTRQTFADVPATNPFWVYIERAAGHGVIAGYNGDGRTINPCLGTVELAGPLYFRACNPVTRSQTAKFIANAFFPSCTGH